MSESEVSLGRRLMTIGVVASAAAGVIVLALACVLVFPAEIVNRDALALTGAEQLKAENDVRTTLLQAVGGLAALAGVAVGATMTVRQLRASREGHTIALFTRAIEHLSSSDVSVRHGGVYELEQIAGTAPHYRAHVAALLTAFVRQHAPWPPVRPMSEVDAERQRYHGGLPDDVGAAMAALSRGSMIPKGAWMELEKVDLRGADLTGSRLSRFCFIGSNLEGAILREADLRGSILTKVNLQCADLTRARLTGAELVGTDLTGAILDGADLDRVKVDDATSWPDGFGRLNGVAD